MEACVELTGTELCAVLDRTINPADTIKHPYQELLAFDFLMRSAINIVFSQIEIYTISACCLRLILMRFPYPFCSPCICDYW